ncbi:MAG: ABC transporter permease [Actinomycetota bacterium]|nr:ABC transporter permease [Actinomycetota bacterium]
MSAATQIASKDLKLRFRDRSAIIIGIIAPLVLAVIFNLIFGGAGDAAVGLDLDYGMVDLDQSQLTTEFTNVLEDVEEEGILNLDLYASRADAETAIDEGDIDAFYLILEGFQQDVFTGSVPTIEVIGNVDAPISTNIAASIAEQFSSGIEATQLAIQTAIQVGKAPPPPDVDPSSAAFSYVMTDESAETRQLDATTFYAAGMSVFFLFFTVQYGVLGLIEEERDGTMVRLMAAPMPRSSIIVAKAILSFTLGVISMGVLIGATSLEFLMGADWGAPAGVALLVITGILSGVGIMGLVASFAKTAEGAGSLGAIVAVILGMMGGVFFPLGSGDDLLSKLTFLTPHAWFMRGLGDLAGDAPWTNALPAAGAMLVFALVTGAISWVLLNRRLAR